MPSGNAPLPVVLPPDNKAELRVETYAARRASDYIYLDDDNVDDD